MNAEWKEWLRSATFVFGEDGRTYAHSRRVKVLVDGDTGEHVPGTGQEIPAQPEDVPLLVQYLGEQVTTFLTEIATLTAEKAVLDGQLHEVAKVAEQAEAGRIAALARIAALEAELSQLGAVQGT